MEWRETFRRRLDDPEYRDAVYDEILELLGGREIDMRFKKITDSAHAPTKAHTFDAGWDLYSDEHIAIMPGTRQAVKTGIAIDIPQGFVGLIWPRSGLAANWSLQVMGGVVDSGYHGEIIVLLYNAGLYTYTAAPGERIAQLLVQPVQMLQMHEVEDFGYESVRGQQGFGSTGK